MKFSEFFTSKDNIHLDKRTLISTESAYGFFIGCCSTFQTVNHGTHPAFPKTILAENIIATAASSSAICASCMSAVTAGWIIIERANHSTTIGAFTSITFTEHIFAIGATRNTILTSRVFAYCAFLSTIRTKLRITAIT